MQFRVFSEFYALEKIFSNYTSSRARMATGGVGDCIDNDLLPFGKRGQIFQGSKRGK